MENVRVRYAPSPTGPQHIGGIRTALYNYLFAKKHGGKFILRIEDTDEKRYVESAEQYLIDSVKWCGFEFDEGVHVGGEYGPYKQSERKALYKPYADQLIENGYAYIAFDTSEELDAKRKEAEANKANWQYDGSTRMSMTNSLTLSEANVNAKIAAGDPFVVRIKMPVDEDIVVNDIIRGKIVVNSSQLDDKVILKEGAMPTYHLANIVDDHLMKISHVIRGEEWLPSAPLHVMLYKYLGLEESMPQFAHLPLLLKPNGNGKLSKRDGDALGFPVFPLEWTDPKTGEVSSGYRESGYFSDAFLNILAFLGWNPGTEQELFSLEELVQAFSLEKVGKSGSKFDFEKAKWFNSQYLVKKSNNELLALLKEKSTYSLSDESMLKVIEMMKPRATFLEDLVNNASYFFEAPTSYDEKMVRKKWKDQSAKIVSDIADQFEKINSFLAEEIETTFKKYVEDNELGFGVAMIGLRLTITGLGGGPSLFEIAEIIGKEETINRMRSGVEAIDKIKAVKA